MKNNYRLVFILTMISRWYLSDAQVPSKSNVMGYDRYYQQAKLFFDQGDYFRARNLYKACLRLPGVSPESQLNLMYEIKRGVEIERLKDEALARFRQGDKEGAKTAYQKILKPTLNPNDSYIKAALKQIDIPSSIGEEWFRNEILADKFLSQKPPNYQRANELLRQIPIEKRTAAIKSKLEITRDVPNAIANINKKIQAGVSVTKQVEELKNKYPEDPAIQILVDNVQDEKEYWRLSQVASHHVANCRFEQAKVIYRELRHTYPQLARITTTRINKLQYTTQLINEVNALRTDPDPYKQSKVIHNFSILYQTSRKCIVDDYFEYVYNRGVKQMQNEKLPEAIINFERAYIVSKSLANRNRVPMLADSCRKLIACQKQSQVYRALLADAELLYRRCLSDSAIGLYQKAQVYNCKMSDTKAEDVWQNRLAGVTQNRQKQLEFVRLVNFANSLLERNECEEALLLYRKADSTHIDCYQLDKSTLRIADCLKCIKQQCYDTLIAKAELSRAASYRRDELRYYRAALDCPAPESRMIDLQKKINELDCLLNGIGCPGKLSSLPDTLDKLYRPSLLLGGNGMAPQIFKQGEPLAIVPNLGYSFGIRLERIAFTKPLDFRIDMRYVKYRFNQMTNDNYIRQSFELANVECTGGLKLHMVPELGRQSRLRPYIHGSLGYTLPVSYKSQDFYLAKSSTNLEDRSNGFVTGRVGLGTEIQKSRFGLSLEFYYGLSRKDLFNQGLNRTIQNVDNYSAPKANFIGAELGIRFW